LLSIVSALSIHSSAQENNASSLFAIARALFAKILGVASTNGLTGHTMRASSAPQQSQEPSLAIPSTYPAPAA